MKRGEESLFFQKPGNPKHRLYEALRAVYVDQLPFKEAAKLFDYTVNTLHVLSCHFRAGKLGPFFIESKPGPKSRPKRDPVHDLVLELRKKNCSIYDISRILKNKNHHLSPRSVWQILTEEGFARLPRRLEEERPDRAKPEPAPQADCRLLDLSPKQTFKTQAAGLFLFLPDLVNLNLPRHLAAARYPGTSAIPALQYFLSLLALKLLGRDRYSHVMDCCHDPGLGLFTGLNAIPKTTSLTTYSYRLVRNQNVAFLRSLLRSVKQAGLVQGESINLDFHSIPHYGEESVLEKNYVPRRSHAEKSILVCLGQDADTKVLCYSNACLLKKDKAAEVVRVAKFWKKSTGSYPPELVFDSQFTTIEQLNELNQLGIHFITLRKRNQKLLSELLQLPKPSWETCTLDVPHRKYKTPRVYESRIKLKGYDGFLRQIAATDFGKDLPTVLITNHTHSTTRTLLTRYAQRMLIENAIADGVHFFHLDALCSSLNVEVDFSVLQTVVGDILYHQLARRIDGYGDATARQIFRKFINASGDIVIEKKQITVHFNKRAHNPLLMAAGFEALEVRIPWLKDYVVRYSFP